MAFYSEQAEIPQIALRSGGQKMPCLACGKMTIAFDNWPRWCVCGWNVDAARHRLNEMRWLPASVAFVPVVAVLGFRFLGFIRGRIVILPDWKLIALVVAIMAAAICYGYHLAGWYASALKHARQNLPSDHIPLSVAPAGWTPEPELLQLVPRPVRAPDFKEIRRFLIIPRIMAVGGFAAVYFNGALPAESRAKALLEAGAIAAGIMLLIPGIYSLVWKESQREAELLRRGGVAPALVTKVEGSEPRLVHWTWQAPSGARERRSTDASEFELVPLVGTVISVLYEPDNPDYCKPYCTLRPTLKNAKAMRRR